MCVCKHLAQLCLFVQMHLCGKPGRKGRKRREKGRSPTPTPALLTEVNQQL